MPGLVEKICGLVGKVTENEMKRGFRKKVLEEVGLGREVEFSST